MTKIYYGFIMKPSDFIHPEDGAALRQMESVPGLKNGVNCYTKYKL